MPLNKEISMSDSNPPVRSDIKPSFNMTPFVDVNGNYPSTSGQSEHIPFATAINPFFPPLNPYAPSPHKRHRERNSDEEKKDLTTIPNWNDGQRNDIFAEIEELVCLEVIKTRY